MKKLIYAFIIFSIVSLLLLSWNFFELWPLLYKNRNEVISLFGLRDQLRFIDVFIDNISVMLGGGLKYLFFYNLDLIVIYFLIFMICVFLSKRLKLQLNHKHLILFNSVLIFIYIAFIVLTRNWPLINILMLILFLIIHGLVWLPRLITKKNSVKACIGQGIIFCCISILLIVLTGNNSEKADVIKGCGYYDVKISYNPKKVFYEQDNGQYTLCGNWPEKKETIEVLESDNFTASKVLYKGNLGQYLSIDEDRGNFYFTDRNNKKLVIMDINDYSIKDEVYHPMIDEGDGFITYDKDHIYLLSEDHLGICKIDVNTLEIVKMRIIDHDAEGASFTFDNKDTLYATNLINYNNNLFFIWVINPLTLETVKRVPVDGPIVRMIFLKKKDTLYHTMQKDPLLISSYVSVRDANSLKIKDKIIVPFGLRDIAIDEKRGLLFAGNYLTGIVEVIELNNKKIVKLIKTSNRMLRRLALDTTNRYVYITTWNGIYRYGY